MATNLPAEPTQYRRAIAILIGHNLPFVLWSFAAGVVALFGTNQTASSGNASSLSAASIGTAKAGTFTGELASGWCPVHHWFDFCPGCGLTRQYAHFFLTGKIVSVWLGVILAGFVCVAVMSVFRARHVGRQGLSCSPTELDAGQ